MEDNKQMVFGFVPSIIDDTVSVLKDDVYETLPIPSEYTYYDLMSPILNQGAESTCVPHSVSSFYDYWFAMNNKNVRAIDGTFKNTGMSIHQVYDAKTNTGEGMSYRDALDFCRDHGVTSEKNYIHNIKNKDLIKIADYAFVPNLLTIKKCIVMNGPVLIATMVRSMSRKDFWNGNENYGGHATSLIGYSDSRQAFLLRNSWGKGWGDNGYVWFPYADFHNILEAWTVIGK